MIDPEIVGLLRKEDIHITLPEIGEEDVDTRSVVSAFSAMLAASKKDDDDRNPHRTLRCFYEIAWMLKMLS